MGSIQARNFMTKSGDSFVIRTILPADAGKVLEFNKAIFKEALYLITTTEEFKVTPEQETEWLQKIYNDKNKLAIAAEQNGKLIGYLDFHNGHRYRTMHQGSFGMSVAHTHRNQGVGKALLSVLLDWAKQNPIIEKVSLEVFAANKEAISLYQKFGFIQEGVKTKAIRIDQQNYHDVIIMANFV